MTAQQEDSTSPRLFFGVEIASPWPDSLPEGRLIPAPFRHTTLAFLGNVPLDPLKTLLSQIPLPHFAIAPTGRFDRTLLLPPQSPNVAAWHIQWDEYIPLLAYQRQLTDWLRVHGYSLELRDYLPHVTLARKPFDRSAWQSLSPKFPLYGRALHLYESKGNLTYEPLWSHPWITPFVELSHTADIAFLVRGENLQQLLANAQLALSFVHPPFLDYLQSEPTPDSLDALIQALNRLIARADAALGVPLKAVSYHGHIFQDQQLLAWEMIVDV